MARIPNRLVLDVFLQSLEIALWTAAFLLGACVSIAVVESRIAMEDAAALFESTPIGAESMPAAAAESTPAVPTPTPAAADTLVRRPAAAASSASSAPRRPARPVRPPAAGSMLGRLEAPSVRLTVAVREGTSARTLLRGAGRIAHTARPGQRGNIGIAGHRDTVFRPLRGLKLGDPLTFTTADRVLRYRVTKIWVVHPRNVGVLNATARPSLTLVTCYPFNFIGSAPRRYIVRAELVHETTRGHPPQRRPAATD
jgi:sortase A